MSFYLGFLKKSTKHVIVFMSVKKPVGGDFRYFVKVVGPYVTEQEARNDLKSLQLHGYKENPAVSERQRKFMCTELGRKRAGKRTRTTMTERQLRDFCMKRKKNPGGVINDKQALKLTKKIIAYGKRLLRHERSELKNPVVEGHQQKFLHYMNQLEKYVVGSRPYIELLAKAYKHLESIKASR